MADAGKLAEKEKGEAVNKQPRRPAKIGYPIIPATSSDFPPKNRRDFTPKIPCDSPPDGPSPFYHPMSAQFVKEMKDFSNNFSPPPKDYDIRNQGFDLPEVPLGFQVLCLGFAPVSDLYEGSGNYEKYVQYAQSAIKGYNTEHGEEYELVFVEKVNAHPVQGMVYYMTFQVKKNSLERDAPLETFQAIVYRPLKGEGEFQVRLCRPKPKPENPKN